MPLLRFILTSLIVVAGLIGAVLLMALGVVVFLFNRLFGRSAPMPRFQASFRTAQPGATARPARRADPTVIDVEATTVKETPSLQDRSNTNR